jgi:hypothetical protein
MRVGGPVVRDGAGGEDARRRVLASAGGDRGAHRGAGGSQAGAQPFFQLLLGTCGRV